MLLREIEVAVIGGGAAGIAAAKRLQQNGRSCILIEAQSRLGGRAYTTHWHGYSLDLGCGWLHSADRNPWAAIAQESGFAIDRTRPPWDRPSNPTGFSISEQKAYQKDLAEFYERADEAGLEGRDPQLSQFLDPNSRWNPLINAVSSYFSGAEVELVSTQDLQNYADTDVNWRAVDGYGALVASHAKDLNVVLNCTVFSIGWDRVPLRVETSIGVVECNAAIVTLPTGVLARQPELFSPRLPEKAAAAERLPLGLADKLFLSLEGAEEFDPDSRLFGHTDRTATAIYHMRPFGRPLIECYFGGACADDLERGGPSAFFEFAVSELTGLFGSNFKSRIAPSPMHLWRSDGFARGSYSYATPGHAGDRAKLASPVADRIYFAGEACSRDTYSTAHGAFKSGSQAADALVAGASRRGAPTFTRRHFL